ncbi:FecR family protein [Halopseudomonas pachastrellae]|uniref:FecR family protein n=1 Tax=Halopseudomonas pachastrellae TaxID=254161 RepID=UPI003D7E19C3
MTNSQDLPTIEDQAANWAVLLADEPDNAEQLAAFEHWLGSSHLHQQIWERTCAVYAGVGQLPPSTRQAWPQSASSARPERAAPLVASRGVRWRRAIGAMAVAACLLLLIWPQLSLRISADYITGTGELKTLRLEDGSEVLMAPHSAVDIDYQGDQRGVRLLKGSAYFVVARDAARPFTVDAGDTRTTVLGTAFNVERLGTGVQVSVAHGQVKVEDHSIRPQVLETLGAGDQLAVTWGEGATRTQVRAQEVAHWRQGQLIARDLRVQEVVDQLRPYYHGVILLDEPFANQRVTGLYSLNDPLTTLSEMAKAHNANATQISPWVLVLR